MMTDCWWLENVTLMIGCIDPITDVSLLKKTKTKLESDVEDQV